MDVFALHIGDKYIGGHTKSIFKEELDAIESATNLFLKKRASDESWHEAVKGGDVLKCFSNDYDEIIVFRYHLK